VLTFLHSKPRLLEKSSVPKVFRLVPFIDLDRYLKESGSSLICCTVA
jgi:hypothetical protein